MRIDDIAGQLRLTVFDVEEVVEPSVHVGWLVYVEQPQGDAVLPARPLDELTFAEMYDLKHNLTLSISQTDAPTALLNLWDNLDEVDSKGISLLSNISIGDFTELNRGIDSPLAMISNDQE